MDASSQNRLRTAAIEHLTPPQALVLRTRRETDTELRKQQAGDHGTHDADDNIAKQAEAGALHEQAGEPACDGANYQGYDQSCHDFPP